MYKLRSSSAAACWRRGQSAGPAAACSHSQPLSQRRTSSSSSSKHAVPLRFTTLADSAASRLKSINIARRQLSSTVERSLSAATTFTPQSTTAARHQLQRSSPASRCLSSASAATSPAVATTDTLQQSAQQTLDALTVGSTHHNWQVIAHVPVHEFNLTVVHLELQGSASKTPWYHVVRQDADQAFCVAFKTPATNDTGVAHILEHCVLCGSERYPVRDPFFYMLRRSLNTYANAMTANHYTMYPISSVNAQDLTNLTEVYLDAVFNPQLTEAAFLQEGHRLAWKQSSDDEQTTDQQSEPKLQRHGIVLNEMKGYFSEASTIYSVELTRHLHGHQWHMAGGVPSTMTQLTHDKLKEFHQRHYHLNNAAFFSYGHCMPPLQLVNERVVTPATSSKRSTPTTPATDTASVTRWSEPRSAHLQGPPDALVSNPAKQHRVSVAWLCKPLHTIPNDAAASELEAVVERTALKFIETLLLDNPDDAMHKALLQSGLGSDYAPSTGLDDSGEHIAFAVGLQGCSEKDQTRIVQTIHDTIKQVARDGFSAERFEAELHQVELGRKSVSVGFGVGLTTTLAGSWANKQPIQPTLSIGVVLEELRKRFKQGYFQQLLQKHLLDNPHHLTFSMSPSEDFLTQVHQTEAVDLQQKQASLSSADKQELDKQRERLEAWQSNIAGNDASCLPGIQVSDIQAEPTHIKLHAWHGLKHQHSDATIPVYVGAQQQASPNAPSARSDEQPFLQYSEEPTNGVLYLRGVIDLSGLPQTLLPYLPLYASLATRMASANYSYGELNQALRLHTGGISLSPSIQPHPHNAHHYSYKMVLGGTALAQHAGKFFDLFSELLTAPRFDVADYELLRQLVRDYASSAVSGLQDSEGMTGYAEMDAAQSLSPPLQLMNQQGGLPQVLFLHQLLQGLDADPGSTVATQQLCDQLMQLHAYVHGQRIERMLVVGDAATLQAAEPHLPSFIQQHAANQLPSELLNRANFTPQPFASAAPHRHLYALPVQTNSVALVSPTVSSQWHADAAPLSLAAQIVADHYMHHAIRERGGAYGSSAVHQPSTGILTFSSSRDPNQLQTVEAIRRAADWVQRTDSLTNERLSESLLGMFRGIDAPWGYGERAAALWLSGKTMADLKMQRSRLLAVKVEDMQRVAAKYISPDHIAAAPVTILGSAEQVDSKLTSDAGWKVKQLTLDDPAGADQDDDEHGTPVTAHAMQ